MTSLFEMFPLAWNWVLLASLQACVLVGVIRITQIALRDRLAPRWHYALWMLLLVRLMMPWAPDSAVSVFNFFTFGESLPVATIPQEVPFIPMGSGAPAFELALAPVAPTFVERLKDIGILPLVWAVGAVALLLTVLTKNVMLWRRIRRAPQLEDARALAVLKSCQETMGIRRRIVTAMMPANSSPALFGFIRPRLLLPKGLLESLSEERMRFIFLHELGHDKRRDIVTHWLMTLLLTVHWFNPLLWYAFYRMRCDRELACDALALSHAGESDPEEYGLTILELIKGASTLKPLSGAIGMLETHSHLKRRISAIALFKSNSYRWSALAVVLLAILSTTLLTDAAKGQDVEPVEAEPTITATPEPIPEPNFTTEVTPEPTREPITWTETIPVVGELFAAQETMVVEGSFQVAHDPATEAIDKLLESHVSIVFEKIHVQDIMEFISDTYDLNIVIDSRVVKSEEDEEGERPSAIGSQYVTDGHVTYISLRDISLKNALDAVLRPLNLDYRAMPGYIWISSGALLEQRTAAMSTPASDAPTVAPTPKKTKETAPEGFGGTTAPKKVSALEAMLDNSLVSVVFEEIHLQEILEFVSDTYDINIMIDNRVVAPINTERLFKEFDGSTFVTDGMIPYISLKDVSLRDAFKALLRPLNLSYSVQDSFIWVSTPEKIRTESFEALETRSFPMSDKRVSHLFPDGIKPNSDGYLDENSFPGDFIKAVPAIHEPQTDKKLSYFRFNFRAYRLIAYNSPENLDLLESYLESL